MKKVIRMEHWFISLRIYEAAGESKKSGWLLYRKIYKGILWDHLPSENRRHFNYPSQKRHG